MEELTNQSDDIELDLGLGSDEPEESKAEPETSEEAEETEETPDTFELGIRYNGNDMKLSREEATTLAQKGMNYDKMYQRLQALENDPVRKIFQEQAESAGLTLQEFANRLQGIREEYSKREIAREFKTKNPDISDEAANEYAEQAFNSQKLQRESERRSRQEQAKKETDDALVKEVQSFSEKYPDVKIEELPNEVIDDINSGTKLETAYLRHVVRELQKKVSNIETNAKNKSKNIGSASDNIGSSGNADDFISGLLG